MAKGYLTVAYVGVAALLSSHVEVRHFCFYYSILSEPLQRRSWVGNLSLGPFWVEFASSLCWNQFSPSLPASANSPKTFKQGKICHECIGWWLQMAVCLSMWPRDKLPCLWCNRRLHAKKVTEKQTKPTKHFRTCTQQLCHLLSADKQTFRQRSWCKTARGRSTRPHRAKAAHWFSPSYSSSTTTWLDEWMQQKRGRTFTLWIQVYQHQTDQSDAGPGLPCGGRQGKERPDRWVLMGTSGHLGRDGADCEGVCVGAFDACQTVASQGRGERQRSFFFFFSRMKNRRYSQTVHHMGERLRFVKSTGFDKTQEARETICWSVFTENTGGLKTLWDNWFHSINRSVGTGLVLIVTKSMRRYFTKIRKSFEHRHPSKLCHFKPITKSSVRLFMCVCFSFSFPRFSNWISRNEPGTLHLLPWWCKWICIITF